LKPGLAEVVAETTARRSSDDEVMIVDVSLVFHVITITTSVNVVIKRTRSLNSRVETMNPSVSALVKINVSVLSLSNK
jgi:uncharacterized protein (DUF39 family)